MALHEPSVKGYSSDPAVSGNTTAWYSAARDPVAVMWPTLPAPAPAPAPPPAATTVAAPVPAAPLATAVPPPLVDAVAVAVAVAAAAVLLPLASPSPLLPAALFIVLSEPITDVSMLLVLRSTEWAQEWTLSGGASL